MCIVKIKEFKKEIKKNLKKHNFKKDDNVFVASNLSCFGKIKIDKKTKLKILFDIIIDEIIPNGTLFVPTGSLNLCNTNIPFDIENTPSKDMGAFSEYVRYQKKSIRSMHPFWSVTGIGKNANVLKKVSRHSYGIGSPWGKFIDLNTKQLNIGVHPSRAVTLIHHIETLFGVPYRYTKEFKHKIKTKSKINFENFYLSVLYNNTDINKKIDLNSHYFKKLKQLKKLNFYENNLSFKTWSFKMKDFYNVALEFFISDIYNYLENEPSIKPFTK